MATPVTRCRICGSSKLEDVLSLGDMPPVNSFLSGPSDFAAEKKHPLAIVFCPSCTHTQLTHMLDPKDIFTDYIYFSSMSETVVRWGEQLARRYAEELRLGKDDLVAELASNDGCILKPFAAHCRILGVEPAKNIAQVANENGVPTRASFFNGAFADAIRQEVGPARLILARNVVAHVPEVVDFVAGAGRWLTDDGIFHIEVPYVRDMVEKVEFDTIYHEHLSYFSVTALERLFREAGLVLWDVEEIGLHGGSLIARGKRGATPTANVRRYLDQERARGLTDVAAYREFARATEALKTRIPELLEELKAQGKRLAGYGAAAKGVVLTNYCGIGPELLEWVADRSPHKQGKFMPGMRLPVVGPERIAEAPPDYLLVLAWNFFEEIARQQSRFAEGGGKFILPVPTPSVRPE